MCRLCVQSRWTVLVSRNWHYYAFLLRCPPACAEGLKGLQGFSEGWAAEACISDVILCWKPDSCSLLSENFARSCR